MIVSVEGLKRVAGSWGLNTMKLHLAREMQGALLDTACAQYEVQQKPL